MTYILSFDVECPSMCEKVFAIGYVLGDDEFNIIEKGYMRCPPDVDYDDWVMKNVIPVQPSEITHKTYDDMCNAFWSYMMSVKGKYQDDLHIISDCGCPLETSFIHDCIMLDKENRMFNGPFPLHEVGTAMLLCGLNPTLRDIYIQDDEKPQHNPVNDAKQSYRLFLECMNTLKK